MARLATTRGGSGEPLVLIHGLGSSRTAWDTVRPALERQFDVIAFDLPGFGDQPWFGDGTPARMNSLADAVQEELDALGIERPAIVGHSMGGWIAIELGRRGLARRVIAIAPVGGATPDEARDSRRVLARNRAAARLFAPFRHTLLRSRTVRRLGFRDAVSGEVSYRDAVQSVGHMARCEGFPRMLDDVAGEGDLIDTNRSRFAEVECPVLIIYGERDRILSANAGPRIAEAIPGAELRMLPGWGHSPIMDRADEVAEMVVSRCSP